MPGSRVGLKNERDPDFLPPRKTAGRKGGRAAARNS